MAPRPADPEYLAHAEAFLLLQQATRGRTGGVAGTLPRGRYRRVAILRQPDRTAVLLEDTIPRCAVGDGQSVKLADVNILTVVEQTAGRAPKRKSYDLTKLQQREVWVYRPVGMAEYLGSTLSIDIPSRLDVFAV